MELTRILGLTALLLVAGCFASKAPAQPAGHVQSEASRFSRLDLRVGMNREQVERQVASLLSRPNRYSPYGNNLEAGVVEYRDGDWVLEVTYQAGAPAPWVRSADGSVQHHPPMDATVLAYRISRVPK